MQLCPRCRKSGFNAEVGFNRPSFRCQACNHTWTCGHRGEPYFSSAQNTKGRSHVEFREHAPEPRNLSHLKKDKTKP
jgi:hypothetical protein